MQLEKLRRNSFPVLEYSPVNSSTANPEMSVGKSIYLSENSSIAIAGFKGMEHAKSLVYLNLLRGKLPYMASKNTYAQ